MKRATVSLAVFLGLSTGLHAGFEVTKLGDSVVDAKALTIEGGFGQCINGMSFQQDAVVTHEGYQYVAYYDAERRVCLARRNLPDGDWRGHPVRGLRLQEQRRPQHDLHGHLPARRDHPPGLRPSRPSASLPRFPEGRGRQSGRPWLGGFAVRPVALGTGEGQADRGHLSPFLADSRRRPAILLPAGQVRQRRPDARRLRARDRARWIDTRQIDSRAGVFQDHLGKSGCRCSYPNGYDYGPGGELHVTWVWRESSQGPTTT